MMVQSSQGAAEILKFPVDQRAEGGQYYSSKDYNSAANTDTLSSPSSARASDYSPRIWSAANIDYESKLMPDPTREEIDAKFAASEAHTETRVTRLEGKIDTMVATIGGRIDMLGSKIDALNDKASAAQADNRETRTEIRESRRWVMGTVIAVGVALAGLMAALWTYGDAMFARGMNVRELVQTTIKEMQAPPDRK
jgi:hypothetical protein